MASNATAEHTASPVALPCPDCVMAGRGGDARIGNQRSRCGTCNRWVQAVLRATQRRLAADVGPDRYAQIRAEIEMGLYPDVIARVGAH